MGYVDLDSALCTLFTGNLTRQIKTVDLQLYAPLRNEAEILAKGK